jgi:hypothetical protein
MADANSARRIHGLMLSSNTITDSSSWPLDPIPSLKRHFERQRVGQHESRTLASGQRLASRGSVCCAGVMAKVAI